MDYRRCSNYSSLRTLRLPKVMSPAGLSILALTALATTRSDSCFSACGAHNGQSDKEGQAANELASWGFDHADGTYLVPGQVQQLREAIDRDARVVLGGDHDVVLGHSQAQVLHAVPVGCTQRERERERARVRGVRGVLKGSTPHR